ncbi:MAG: Rieske (2Fe-2S) protein [Gammaproteobacteria bacterium]|nr:MAG: Rieske (2Fe-2S) protein [Gammaproteobacteria bacterium]
MLRTELNINDILDNSSKGFEVNNQKYFAVKTRNKIYVYKNACPHIGIPLEWVEDQFLDSSHSMIQCANHGALFVIENGACVTGPCNGKKLIAINFDVIDGFICLQQPN